jgi:hypothetical protein
MSKLSIGAKVRLKSEMAEHAILDPTKVYVVQEMQGSMLTVTEEDSPKKRFVISENLIEIIEIIGIIQKIILFIKKIFGR